MAFNQPLTESKDQKSVTGTMSVSHHVDSIFSHPLHVLFIGKCCYFCDLEERLKGFALSQHEVCALSCLLPPRIHVEGRAARVEQDCPD